MSKLRDKTKPPEQAIDKAAIDLDDLPPVGPAFIHGETVGETETRKWNAFQTCLKHGLELRLAFKGTVDGVRGAPKPEDPEPATAARERAAQLLEKMERLERQFSPILSHLQVWAELANMHSNACQAQWLDANPLPDVNNAVVALSRPLRQLRSLSPAPEIDTTSEESLRAAADDLKAVREIVVEVEPAPDAFARALWCLDEKLDRFQMRWDEATREGPWCSNAAFIRDPPRRQFAKTPHLPAEPPRQSRYAPMRNPFGDLVTS